MQQGELSMVCVGLSERHLKNLGGTLGGQAKFLGGSGPPWHLPAPTLFKSKIRSMLFAAYIAVEQEVIMIAFSTFTRF